MNKTDQLAFERELIRTSTELDTATKYGQKRNEERLRAELKHLTGVIDGVRR